MTIGRRDLTKLDLFSNRLRKIAKQVELIFCKVTFFVINGTNGADLKAVLPPQRDTGIRTDIWLTDNKGIVVKGRMFKCV